MGTWVKRGTLPDLDDLPVNTEAIAAEVEAEVLSDLEPPVDLTVLFENSLA